MKVIQLPDELPQGNLLFAPRLAPRVLRAQGGGLDLGLSELTNVPLGRLRGMIACVMEMRGAPLQVLLLFVEDSRPLMVQAAKLRLASFELEEARPPESLRVLVRHLAETAPHVAVDGATQRFLEGAALPEIGARIVDSATAFGGLLLKECSADTEALEDAKTAPAEADEPAAPVSQSDSAQSDLAQSDLAQSDLAQSDLAQSDLAQSDLAQPPSAPAAFDGESSAAAEFPPLWLDPAQQCLLASDGDALLVARSHTADLETWARAIRGGKNPRIILGSDALAVPLADLHRVEHLRERRRFALFFETAGSRRKERLAYSDQASGERLFELLHGLLPQWRHQHRTLSLKAALMPLLALPAVLAGLWLALMALALQADDAGPGELVPLFGPLGPEGAVMVGLIILALALLPALGRLRQPPPECEELVPPEHEPKRR